MVTWLERQPLLKTKILMEKSEFIKLVESAKKHIYNRGKEIAKLSNISFAKYRNYINGYAPDVLIRIEIAKNIRLVLAESKTEITKLLKAST